MRDKWVLITGATGGIGLATAIGLARKNARLAVVGRNAAAGSRAVEQLLANGATEAEFWQADLSSQTEIRRLAADFRARHDHLDVLLNNAGGFFPERRESVDEIEMTLALNQIAPFLLTYLLRPLLTQSRPSRVVNVNSGAHRMAKPPFDHDPQWRNSYHPFRAYAQAKLINLLWSYELSRVLKDTGITVNALHPGVAYTELTKGLPTWMRLYIQTTKWRNTLERAAETSIYLASSDAVAAVSGLYFVNRKPAQSSRWTYDRILANNAMDLSRGLTGLLRGEQSIGAVTAPPGLATN